MNRVAYTITCQPCGKKLYADRRDAKRAVRVLFPNERGAMNAYPCPNGNDGHHIGHRPGSRTPPTWPFWNDAHEQRRCSWCDDLIHYGQPVAWTDDGDGLCLDCGEQAEREAIAWANAHPAETPAQNDEGGDADERAPHIEPHPAVELPTPRSDTATDRCRPVTVTGDDGQPITVHVLGAEPMTDEAAHHFEAIVQAALRRHASENRKTP